MAMHPHPALSATAHEDDAGPAGPVEGAAILVVAGAAPGGDGHRHLAIGAGQHAGGLSVEGEAISLGPDAVPLPVPPIP